MPGPAPKPSKTRMAEGCRAHRPLPKEPKYSATIPEAPKGISASAKRIWNELVDEMAAAGVLCRVDRNALWQLCEDEALLVEARKMAAEQGTTALLTTPEGKQAMQMIRDLSARIIVERREFGLTPASRTRVSVASRDSAQDEVHDMLFGASGNGGFGMRPN